MKKLPIGLQSLPVLLRENCVYVDKTKQIYKLITNEFYCFLSHPRRFGKSLLVSTLKEIFSGNKELFKPFYIYNKTDYAWPKHPVIHIDFTQIARGSPQELRDSLKLALRRIYEQFNITPVESESIEDHFKYLILGLSEINSVVVLIDEYDAPILDHLDNLCVAKEHRLILRNFYGIMKGLNEYIRFVFLTGIARFSRISLFSGLNNLIDLSHDAAYADILGYTENEIGHYFKDHIDKLASTKKVSFEKIIAEMKEWYNGYRFSESEQLVYNPFSVLLYLKSGQFKNYWYETGNPSFLIPHLRDKFKTFENIIMGRTTVRELGNFALEDMPLVTLLFQTGYLTVKDYNEKLIKYRLGFPNKEVKVSFERLLVSLLTHRDEPTVDTYMSEIEDALEANELDKFFINLRELFAHIPYHLHISEEKYYHSLFQFMGTLMGYAVESEIATDTGRIDVTLITKKYVYVFEFKFNKSSLMALKQIEQKKYYQKYLKSKRTVILVGVSFNRTKKEFKIDYRAKELVLR